MKKIAILGSTGSIGTQALDIVAQNPDDFQVIALSAHSNIDLLLEQIIQFKPLIAALTDSQKANLLQSRLPENSPTKIISGPTSLTQAATHPETELVLTALIGAIGIEPTHAAIQAGKTIALANKETLVAAGPRIIAASKQHKAQIIPVDSEHSAIFQCLQSRGPNAIDQVEKIILTCSGGPFLGKTRDELQGITPAQALDHPTWDMGAKISIDSATLANKGLEVIEAHYLFNLPPEKIEVVIHPQSIIHSMVQFKDGNLIAQLGSNDMRIPISYALYYPQNASNQLPRLPLPTHSTSSQNAISAPSTPTQNPLTSLTFSQPDTETFPALSLAYQSLTLSPQAPATYNSANELAVQKFLNHEIPFLEISEQIKQALKI